MPLPVPNKPHVTKVMGGVSNVSGSHETMCLSSGDGRLWLQEGRLFDESGRRPDPIPDWFWEEFGKMSPEMQQVHAAVTEDLAEDAPERQALAVGEMGQNNPGPRLAKKAGDYAGRGGNPDVMQDHQLSPEVKTALDMKEALAARDKRIAEGDAGDIDAPGVEGSQGKPKRADEADLNDNTKAELLEIAEAEGVETVSGDTKADLVSKIEAKRKRD